MNIEQRESENRFISKISVKPYVAQGATNMGLEKYDMSVHDGVHHEEPIICLTHNNIKRYKTGLNEFAPEIKNLDPISRKTKIKQIRENVILLEKELASNVLDIKDEKFWEHVKIIRPDNFAFWDSFTIRMGNKPLYFSPSTNPHDLIKILAIEAGGFSMIAPSLEAARNAGNKYKFYLDKEEETIVYKTEIKKMRNKALSELQKMYDKNQNKLFYVAKIIDEESAQYLKSTPMDIFYDNMDNYINGLTVESNKKKTAQRFIDITKLDMETLKMRAIIRDAHYLKVISLRGDGCIYHLDSNTMIGKNTSEILEFMKNPLNDSIMDLIMGAVEKHWNYG